MGSNTLNFSNATSASVIDLTAGTTTGFSTDTISNFGKVVGSNYGDTITGSTGSDSIVGGSSNNYFYATTGADTLNGGVGGTNTINFSNATAAVTVNLTTGTASGYGTDTLSNFTKIVGSSHGDTLTGSTGNDSITGGSGSDLFKATTGSDTYVGGGGTDTLSYTSLSGSVTLHLDTSSSTDFQSGVDSFSGFTTYVGTNHNDTIIGSTGNDSVLGGSGNNLFYASTGADTLNGGVGGTNTVDFVNATSAVTVNLTAGTASGYGTDTLSNFTNVIGSTHGDTITGSTGNDSIVGGSGNNLIYATLGADTLNGGVGGINTVDFVNATSALTINLSAGTASGWGVDTLSNFQKVIGSNFGDTITGSTGNDSITGGTGNNYFYATSGTDTLNGGTGGVNTPDFLSSNQCIDYQFDDGYDTRFCNGYDQQLYKCNHFKFW